MTGKKTSRREGEGEEKERERKRREKKEGKEKEKKKEIVSRVARDKRELEGKE